VYVDMELRIKGVSSVWHMSVHDTDTWLYSIIIFSQIFTRVDVSVLCPVSLFYVCVVVFVCLWWWLKA